MIWHQILMNGQQNTLLPPIALVLTLALIGVAITTIATITRAIVTTSMRLIASRTLRSGPHFICNSER